MRSLISDAWDIVIGGGGAAVVAALVIFFLYRLARHQLLLFGVVSPTDRGLSSPQWKYCFYLQNLEDVSFDGPLFVRITDTCAGEAKAPEVAVYAGPKHVDVCCGLDKDGAYSFAYWEARFEMLAPYDTWKFECISTSASLKFEIDTGESNNDVLHRLIRDVSERTLNLKAATPGIATSYGGPTVMPSVSLFITTVVAWIVLFLLLVAVATHWRDSLRLPEFGFGPADLGVIGLVALLLWIGFRRIQRRVYPVIQGHFLQTQCHTSQGDSKRLQ